jgi:hypothetical protein
MGNGRVGIHEFMGSKRGGFVAALGQGPSAGVGVNRQG